MELLARLIEHGLGARELDGNGDAVAAHELALLAHIGVGDDHRILDQRLHLAREQAVEAAVERHASDHGDQDRGGRGDDGEQGDDAHMQPRRRAPAPPRLHDPPHLASDDQDEKKNGDRVGGEERDYDLVGRRDRGEAPEHHEVTSADRRASATAPRPSDRATHPDAGAAATVARSAVGAWPTLVIKLVSPQTGTRDSAYARPLGDPLLIAGIFH